MKQRPTIILLTHRLMCYCSLFTVLEVYQFARDAAVAETWLIAQEPYLLSLELGVSAAFTFCTLTVTGFS